MINLVRLRAAYERSRDELLAERTPDGHWVGELSSSALSTATAVSALAVVRRNAGWDQLDVGGDKLASASAGPPSPELPLVGRRELRSLVPPYGNADLDALIRRGVAYLVTQQNEDGGFGDTDLSHSNIATTMLVVAALHLATSAVGNALRGVPGAANVDELLARANAYIDAQGRMHGLRERYGIDKTFVVPIMTNLAIAGLVEWHEIDPLPFELACVPQSLYRFVGMPVVSYAIPALVAIGQAQFHHAPPRNPVMRLIRWLSIKRSLQVLRRMQPDSGGYLEATPLTSFVVMSLAATQGSGFGVQGSGAKTRSQRSEVRAEEVIREGVKFLANSIRPDGSWPIDTNLATWNTTLAINALAGAGEDVAGLLGPRCLDWLLSCQHTKPHPFTGADPGGFGWSDLSGAVPDADDTPGAILALDAWKASSANSEDERKRIERASLAASYWLMRLQNRDGGWPTFCRGWGRLPFDRSGTDLTAHVLRAIDTQAINNVGTLFGERYDWTNYLRNHQHAHGSWSPLWFGNQDHPDEDNPIYGTAKVLMAYRDLGLVDSPEAQRGVAWLVANQNEDGGWGSGVWGKVQSAERGVRSRSESRRQGTGAESLGVPVLSTKYSVLSTNRDSAVTSDPLSTIPNPKSQIPNLKSSVEETALAVEALLAACTPMPRNATEGVPYSASEPRTLNPEPSLLRGLAWLLDRVERGEHRQPAPIGFYFAKLWYYERLYPLTFTVAALGRACRQFARTTPEDLPAASPDSPTS